MTIGTWNHRVFKITTPHETYFEIREVYYNDKKATALRNHTIEACSPMGETIEELRSCLEKMLKSLDQEVLTEEDFKIQRERLRIAKEESSG